MATVNMSFTKSEFVCDSSAIRLRVGCGHKHPCVFHGRKKKATLLVGIEMSCLGYRDFLIFFSVSRSFDLPIRRISRPAKKNGTG